MGTPMWKKTWALWLIAAACLSVRPGTAADSVEAGEAARRARVASFFDRSRQRIVLAAPVVLAQDEQAAFDIVIDPEASVVVRFAAQELQRYLRRISGAEFAVLTEAGAKPAIRLGDTPQAEEVGIDVASLARDGYGIHARSDGIIVAGRDDQTDKAQILFEVQGKASNDYVLSNDMVWDFERGTLCGVYALLEELGCRWFFPGPHGEVVPERSTLEMPALTSIQEPEFSLRVFGRTTWRVPAERQVPILDMRKREIRDLGMNGVANRMWLVRVRASSEWFAFNHRPPRTRWEHRFGAAHPEYFALQPAGQRDLRDTGRIRTGHLCYTEPSVFAETVKDVDAYFSGLEAASRGITTSLPERREPNRGWPPNACYGDTVSMLPNDGFWGCHCPDCLARTREDAPAWERHSDLVWPFVARVGRHVESAHPDKVIICLAYASYSKVPASVDLPDNVIVGVCPRRLNKIYNVVGESSYRDLMALVDELSGVNDMPLLYWFHHLFRLRARQSAYYGVPMFLPHFFQRLIRDLAPHGRLFFAEMDHDSDMFEHLNRYVVMRLLYAPESDVGALLDDYAQALYGPGAPFIRPLLTDLEAKSVEIASGGLGTREIWRELYTEDILQGYRRAVSRAREQTVGTRYGKAVDLFGTYVVGLMEEGRARYTAQFENDAAVKQATLDVPRARQAPVIDGAVDEASWEGAAERTLTNNVDGTPVPWESTVRVMHRGGTLYCAFVLQDPRLTDRGVNQIFQEDYIEVFVQPDSDSPQFYQILVYPSGRVLDFRCDASQGKWDREWQSKVRYAAKASAESWSIELAIPVSESVTDQRIETLSGRTWRGLFCRTIMQAPKEKDRFSSSSPTMRGGFRQPDLFGTLIFE